MRRLVSTVSIFVLIATCYPRQDHHVTAFGPSQPTSSWQRIHRTHRRCESLFVADQDNATSSQNQTLRLALEKVQRLMDSDSASSKKRGASVEIQDSSIQGAGLGLFATTSIKAGTVVAYYPVHGLGVDFGDDSTICLALTEEDETHFANQNVKSNYLLFLMGQRPLLKAGGLEREDFGGGVLFIDANPSRPNLPGWMAHIVNDGATVKTNDEQGILEYYDASRQAKNCVHVPFGPSPMIATVTTRKIKKGQELFTTYGCSYWLEAMMHEDEESTDITEAIQFQVKEAARDILTTMQGVVVRNEKEIRNLQAIFDARDEE